MSKKNKNNMNQVEKPKRLKGASGKCRKLLDFVGITQDGMIISDNGKSYSRLYRIGKENPEVMETEEAFAAVAGCLQKLPDTVDICFVIENEIKPMSELMASLHLKSVNDALDEYRTDYNSFIDGELQKSNGSISKNKYIALTTYAADLTSAEAVLDESYSDLYKAFRKVCEADVEQVNAVERLAFMRSLLCGDNKDYFSSKFSEYVNGNELNQMRLRKTKVSVKDLVAPEDYDVDKSILQLSENRYCKSLCFPNLPVDCDATFLTKITNVPCEMVAVVDLKSVPRKKLVNQNPKSNQTVPEQVNEKENPETKTETTKLFFGTVTVSIISNSEENLNERLSMIISVCNELSITPSLLFGQQEQGLNETLLFGNKVVVDLKMESEDIFKLLPYYVEDAIDENGHAYGVNAINKNLMMYDRRHSRNANGFFFGDANSDVNYAVKSEMILNMLESDDDVIVIDPFNAYGKLAQNLNGEIIKLSPDSESHINPCDIYIDWDENDTITENSDFIKEKMEFMTNLVETFIGRACSSNEVFAIKSACYEIYNVYVMEMIRKYNEENDARCIDTSICPTLADFYEALLKVGTAESNQLAMAIENYCVGEKNFLTHHTNFESRNRFTVYNLSGVPEDAMEAYMKTCLVNTIGNLMQRRTTKDKKVWIYIAGFEGLHATSASAKYIISYFRQIQKYNGIVTAIVPEAVDVITEDSLWNSAGFYLFLKQSAISRSHIEQLCNNSETLMQYIYAGNLGKCLMYNDSGMFPVSYRLPENSKLHQLISD